MRANVLLLGKSGSGKSSLLNYLWGDVIASADTGRPVTPREDGGAVGIYPTAPLHVANLEVVIHDSWGMEADRADEWTRLLTAESDRREDSDRIDDWFHTVLYCISAKGARVESFEIDAVVRPLIERGHAVAFVLTKCDIATREEIDGVRSVVQCAFSGRVGIVEVGSIGQQLRSSRVTETFGRDLMFELISENFRNNLRSKVHSQLLKKASKECEAWRLRTLRHYDERMGLFTSYRAGLKDVSDWAEQRFKDMFDRLEGWNGQRTREANLMLSRFQSGMLVLSSDSRKRLGDPRNLMEGSELRWGGADMFTHLVMQLIPLVNLAYAFVGKAMHRDLLDERLKAVSCKVVDHIRGLGEFSGEEAA